MTLVIYPPVDAARLAAIRQAAGGLLVVNAQDGQAAGRAMPQATGFFGKITPELLQLSPGLRWVQSPTASLEHFLFPELVEHACQLTNMRGLFSDIIAEHVLGCMLCFARNLHVYARQQMARHWAPLGGEETRVTFATGPGVVSGIDLAHGTLAGKTLGIVGLGSIGKEIARKAQAFDMAVQAIDPAAQTMPGVAVGPLAQLPQLLAASHYLVIAAPPTPETAGMFGQAQFDQMRRDAVLINIGRGAIVQLTHLHAALASGQIRGAALDVFETEPLPADSPLWEMPNLLITPHVAGNAPVIADRHLAVLLDNVRRFSQGEPLVNLVNKRLWY